MDKERIKKIGSIVLDVLLYIFLAICILTVFITLFAKKDSDGAAEVFGHQMRVVTSDSMAACEHTDVSAFDIKDIPIRSMIFVEVMPEDKAEADEWYRSLKVGDVLTFRYVYTTQVTITHRIIAINENPGGGFMIELAGDNKTSEDGELTQVIDTSIPNNTNYVIGKVVGQAKLVGALISFLMEPVGMILAVILPCLIIILFEAFKIFRVLTADKREKEKEEKEKQENELLELRRRLAQLEQENKDEKESKEGDESKEAPPDETEERSDDSI